MDQRRLCVIADRFFDDRQRQLGEEAASRKSITWNMRKTAYEVADGFMPPGLLRALTPANSKGRRVFDISSVDVVPFHPRVSLTSPVGDILTLMKSNDEGAVAVMYREQTRICLPRAQVPHPDLSDRVLEQVLLDHMLPHFDGKMRGHLCLALHEYEKQGQGRVMHQRRGSTGTRYLSGTPAVLVPRG